MQYDLIIFDFDGTLADSFSFFIRHVNLLADQYHFRRIALSELELIRDMHAGALIQHLQLPLWKVPLVARAFKRLMAQHIEQITPFEEIAQILLELHENGVRLALLTSNSRSNVAQVLGAPILACFDHLQCNSALFGKRAKLRRILRDSGVAPGKALFIGDEIRDLEAAGREGVASGAVAWGYTSADALQHAKPHHFFKQVADLRGLIGPAWIR
ncbi:HAD hydrolase-like protein [Chitiniphilus purpureus]|uniref:HAD hydrolase-like protein n=1 Tax=Chitiniphilus purpureus TaxID=2981137 RepID=A0ABY6DK90_9NEIS|nr:HAD hydrolase-like protein [Chitiniphilus sp. CD1]UXY14108.1 HAD hydrolase-like protein [Chitiniphilus sp. CD1]